MNKDFVKKILMDKYETIVMLNPKLNQTEIDIIKKEIFSIINCLNIEKFEDLGIKGLPYEINNNIKAHYIDIIFYANNDLVELEKYYRNNDNVLKSLDIKRKSRMEENNEYNEFLYKILDIYSDYSWENEPLDGDEVDRLGELLKLKLNLINGNITEKEYNKILDGGEYNG